jgi:RNA polymerase sigma-70 factor (ECF subfamily)
MEGNALVVAAEIGSPASGANGLSVFVDMRTRLFRIAYRTLGSAAEAEDIVQDVWLRWQATDRSAVLNAPAYLAQTTARLAINFAQSARSRRERYVATWLPEPVDNSPDPHVGAERGEALELAVLVLLEKLPPTARAAYVLREAFNYPYRQIAAILHTGEGNTRQLVTRARKRIADGPSAPVCSAARQRLLEAFIAAAQTGDLSALEELLAADIASHSDDSPASAGAPVRPTTSARRDAGLGRSRSTQPAGFHPHDVTVAP